MRLSLALTYDTLSTIFMSVLFRTASDEKLGKRLGIRCVYCRCPFLFFNHLKIFPQVMILVIFGVVGGGGGEHSYVREEF